MNFSASDLAKLKSIRDILYDNTPTISVYPGSMETVTSDTDTQVTVANTVRRVMSVWLATDTGYTGTNYYADPKAENFTGSVITLDSALPDANTSVQVAYYYDCPVCGWDDESKAGWDSECTTCNGVGMVLAEGSAVSVPVKLRPDHRVAEDRGMTGSMTTGLLAFRIQAKYEALLRAAIKIMYGGREVKVADSGTGVAFGDHSDAGGVISEVSVSMEYVEGG